MKLGFFYGAMYIQLEDEEVDFSPIEIGDKILSPGQYINQLGENKRTSFEMKEGWYLKYIGRVDNYLLFDTNTDEKNNKNIYYCFAYVNKNILMLLDKNSGRDIRIDTLEVFEKVEIKKLDKQLSLL